MPASRQLHPQRRRRPSPALLAGLLGLILGCGMLGGCYYWEDPMAVTVGRNPVAYNPYPAPPPKPACPLPKLPAPEKPPPCPLDDGQGGRANSGSPGDRLEVPAYSAPVYGYGNGIGNGSAPR